MELLPDLGLLLAERYARRVRPRAAVLFSGGLDSFLGAVRVLEHSPNADLLFVRTDAPYAVLDLQVAQTLATWLGKELRETVSTVPVVSFTAPDSPIIPNRNLFLLAVASAAGYRDIWVSHPIEDLVSDSSSSFIRRAAAVLSASLGEHVLVRNALRGESKTEALGKYLKFGDSDTKKRNALFTRSCYSRFAEHCGDCPACFKRWVALTNCSLQGRFLQDPRKALGTIISAPGFLRPSKWRYALEVLRALRSSE